MTRADRLDPDHNRWHWVAVDLRVWREERNLSQADVARICGVDNSTVSNWESGTAKLPQRRAETLDRVWRTRGHFVRLRTLAESSHDPDWFNAYTRYEERADAISTYSALVLHALFQTEDYARALIEGAQVVDDVEGTLAARMARRQILDSPDAPELRLFVRQSVLEDPVGGPDVMRGQLSHLLELSHRKGVVVRALAKAKATHAGVDGSFTLLRSGEIEHAWSPAVNGGRLVSDPAKIRGYRLRWDLIGDDALSRDSTRSLLRDLMEAMK
ncbi:helix-turn-helix transcriptional regulator [Actinomadura soli]|uniref:Helix-turn-helix transcriptional regulator n=1 Tax=Actinomadura soli TaxID=2508997 RepID=A0A5C4IYE5_9ACTN|nr:helix-turn-helix transcriptional regulator [Actinomadura soli]TMQ80704.1 helix-turn-helix transcriptional regulator [Actinomadura soli]